jgi:hypothetical protein
LVGSVAFVILGAGHAGRQQPLLELKRFEGLLYFRGTSPDSGGVGPSFVVMHRILVVATAGAGGDLQPLMSAASALRERGHELTVLGDRSDERDVDSQIPRTRRSGAGSE